MNAHRLPYIALTVGLAALAAAAGCGGSASSGPLVERDVTIETSACGDVSKTSGSGVVVGDGRVLTVAHVVIGASGIDVISSAGTRSASIVQLDPTRDLALLDVADLSAPEIELVDLRTGETGIVIDGGTSAPAAAEVRRLILEVADVGGTASHRRTGYELTGDIGPGNSGAGVFDADGRLGGVVFAISTDRDGVAFAVGAEEIEPLLSSSSDVPHVCNPDASRVVAESAAG